MIPRPATLHAWYVDSLRDLSDALADVRPGFGLFIACDSRILDDLSEPAGAVIDRGGVYLCTWGPGCEQLHDAFDLAYVERGSPQRPQGHLITTWHDTDSLDEALWFFVDVASPEHGAAQDWLAVAIADRERFGQIRSRLADLAGLRTDVGETGA